MAHPISTTELLALLRFKRLPTKSLPSLLYPTICDVDARRFCLREPLSLYCRWWYCRAVPGGDTISLSASCGAASCSSIDLRSKSGERDVHQESSVCCRRFVVASSHLRMSQTSLDFGESAA
eukprot:scaffold2191_cov254-Pinguiococcus_pyrenoidosus.AAC.20